MTGEIHSLERVIVDSYRTTHRMRDKDTADACTQASCVACELHTAALAELASEETRTRITVAAAKIQQEKKPVQDPKPVSRLRQRPGSAPTRRSKANHAGMGKTQLARARTDF